MSDTLLVRERLTVGDRTLTVLAESWFDALTAEWKGRYLFVPLDRSLPHTVASAAVRRSRKRDEVVRQLERVTDRELTKTFRAIALPRRARAG